MDASQFIRDANRVHAHLMETDDGALITTKGCRIYIPARFAEKTLATISNEVYIVGIFAIVVEGKYYGVSLANAMMRIEPTATESVMFGEDEYIEFCFDPGATVISSTQLVRNDTLLYEIYDEVIAKGHVPWYVSYDDLGKLFESSEKHAGVKLGANHAILEMIAAAITRDPDEMTRYYRQRIQSRDEQFSNPPAVIAFRNVTYGATNTTAKLMGAYFDDGLTSALVNPSQRVEPIEEILRR